MTTAPVGTPDLEILAPAVVAEHVRREFISDAHQLVAIEDVSFEIENGESVAIVGRTGCGKSTMLDMLLGLQSPTSGRLAVLGHSPTEDFQYFGGRIAAVFQTDRLLPWRTALDNARVGLEILRWPRDDQVATAREWLRRVGLEAREDAFPNQLSGGMRQRVAMARAFAIDPDVILLDEAFGHLDEVTAEGLRTDFKELLAETGKTTIAVTHNIDEAIDLTNRVLVFGRPARVLLDLHISDNERAHCRADVAEQIRATILANE